MPKITNTKKVKKSTTSKKAKKDVPKPMPIEDNWQAQDDMRILRQASEIQNDTERLSKAKKEAQKQLDALKKITEDKKNA